MLTKEQQQVVDSVMNYDGKIIGVNSVAGSGKTATADAIIKAYKPKNGFYTAFNKAIVTDSNKRFGHLIDARTVHSLAYKYIQPKSSPEDLNYSTIKESLSYEEKALIIEILDDFFRSTSTDIDEYSASRTDNELIQTYVADYANRMLEGKIPITYNYMLKCLHLMLYHKQIEIDFDLVILDECQDTTAVTLEIFKLINADVKIMLGDTFQNIYSFMDTVNAFEELKDINLLKLTKSFRCNENIASMVETYGRKYLAFDFKFSGDEKVTKKNKMQLAYITRTNSALIERMHKLITEERQTFTLTRYISEIFALPIALLNASQGRPVFDKKYKFLEKEYHNYEQVKTSYRSYYDYITATIEDSHIENTIKTLMNFNQKGINLFKLKENVANFKNPNPNIVLTTAHAFKGLEADYVYIEDDLNNSVNRVIQKMRDIVPYITEGSPKDYLTKDQKEDLNTYYVALSRARVHLSNVDYT